MVGLLAAVDVALEDAAVLTALDRSISWLSVVAIGAVFIDVARGRSAGTTITAIRGQGHARAAERGRRL